MQAIQEAQSANVTTAARMGSDFDRLLQREWSPRDMLEGDSMSKMWSMAEAMANSRVSVPEHLRGNAGDCMAICTQAMLWNMNPFAVAQKTHIVSGRLGYEAQLVNAVVQNSGAVRGAPAYEYRGDGNNLECRVGFVLRGQADVAFGEWLHIAAVTTKNSPLWKTNPKQQLGYLQIKNWARAFCPGAILGVYTTDELEDSGPYIGGGSQSVQSPAPAPARAELPAYGAADFEKNMPAWQKLIDEGRGTAQALLTKLSTKAAFSDEQRARILALKPAVQAPPPPPAPAADHDDFVADMNAAEGAPQ
jgi:hypothetical protein